MARPILSRQTDVLFYAIRHPNTGDWLTSTYLVRSGEKQLSEGLEVHLRVPRPRIKYGAGSGRAARVSPRTCIPSGAGYRQVCLGLSHPCHRRPCWQAARAHAVFVKIRNYGKGQNTCSEVAAMGRTESRAEYPATAGRFTLPPTAFPGAGVNSQALSGTWTTQRVTTRTPGWRRTQETGLGVSTMGPSPPVPLAGNIADGQGGPASALQDRGLSSQPLSLATTLIITGHTTKLPPEQCRARHYVQPISPGQWTVRPPPREESV